MENKWVVSKFGGSSVKDAVSMLRCSQIIENNSLTKIVVISATQNTTNQLEFVARAASVGDIDGRNDSLQKIIQEIIQKHISIAVELFTSPAVLNDLEILCGELKALGETISINQAYTPKIMDELYSLGERMSSLLMADLLRLRIPNKTIHFLDARKIIKTNSDFQKAEPQIEVIAKNTALEILPHLNENSIFVTQGFIGSDLLGNTTTLGREGSDYSAALFGEAIGASLVEIWTDVPGVASADPREIDKVNYIKELSYDEATALATLGAKILFPTTLLPAKRKKIPVFVGSSLNPRLGGTTITDKQHTGFSLKAVSQILKNDLIIISFIGTHLDELENLATSLQKDLGESHFEFYDQTEVSISFKVATFKMDKKESLIKAHEVLSKFFV
jgi:aspartate kinase